MTNEVNSLPMVALRGMVVLPGMVTHFDVSREKSIEAIEHAMQENQKIFLTAQKDIEKENPVWMISVPWAASHRSNRL